MVKHYTMQGGSPYVGGSKYHSVVGTRAQVWHGTAHHTSGGLTRKSFMKSHGRIVSRKKHFSAKRDNRLKKAGYGAQKGKFGMVRLDGSKKGHRTKRRSRSRRGGGGVNFPLTPSKYDGQGQGTSGVDLQFVAGNATS